MLTVDTRTGTLTELPETAVGCASASRLGLTLDRAITSPAPIRARASMVYRYVPRAFARYGPQPRMFRCVGQGEIEYGKIITGLSRFSTIGC